MANEDSALLKEVDDALEEDRTWEFFRKNGTALIVGAVAIVAGVAGWQFWNHARTGAAEKQSLEYADAVDLLDEDREAGRAALEAISEQQGGYGELAALRRANSYAAGGERIKALEIYRSVASGDAPKRIRELASIRAGYLALADGRDAVMGDVSTIAEEGGPFSFYARELLGVASINAQDYESAAATFSALSLDLETPAGVRERAEEFAALADAGRAGVNISGELQIEDLVKTLGLDEAQGETGVDETEAASAAPESAGEGDGAENAGAAVAPQPEEITGDASAEDGPSGQTDEE